MNGPHNVEALIQGVPATSWEALADKKIFFGHQSVGQNIIDGIVDVQAATGIPRLNILETRDPRDLDRPVFAHSPIGRNQDPRSKIDDFKAILESGIGAKTDIAIFKFCYVDIDRRTDIALLMDAYKEAASVLRQEFPSLRIVTFTAPLTAEPGGLKPFVKRILGRAPSQMADNKQRALFNKELRKLFGNSVFDIAGIESTRTGGTKVLFKDKDGDIETMDPAFTDDGGHLNPIGRKIVAAELLKFLAEPPQDRN